MFIARPKNTLKLSVLSAVPKFTNQKLSLSTKLFNFYHLHFDIQQVVDPYDVINLYPDSFHIFSQKSNNNFVFEVCIYFGNYRSIRPRSLYQGQFSHRINCNSGSRQRSAKRGNWRSRPISQFETVISVIPNRTLIAIQFQQNL